MESLEKIKVEGMTCNSCATNVSTYLRDSGLENIHVDLGSGNVTYENPVHLDKDKIGKGLKDLGYKLSESKKASFYSGREFWFMVSMLFTAPLLLHMFFSWPLLHNPTFQLILAIPVMFIGYKYFGKSALGSLKRGGANMDVLILMGSTAAFIYSCVGVFYFESHEYLFFETAASILSLVMLGNIIEDRAVAKTRSAIEALIKLQPQTARQIIKNKDAADTLRTVNISDLLIGDKVQVNTGDQIPVDGKVMSGHGSIDESMMTGESELNDIKVGENVLSGTLLVNGNIAVQVTKTGNQTSLSQIIKLMQDAQFTKPAIQRLADKISSWFVPIVIIISILTLIISFFVLQISFSESMMRCIAVMVISCPCAMGLATPTAIAVGIGRAGSKGLLIKDPNALELIDQAKTIIFDKTGTLTRIGKQVDKIVIEKGFDRAEIIGIIAALEKRSTHPVAQGIINYVNTESSTLGSLIEIEEVQGRGMKAKLEDGREVILGSESYTGITSASDVNLLINSQHAASIYFMEDQIRDDASSVIEELKRENIRTVLLSGDKTEKCRRVADDLSLDEWYAQKLPDEKLAIVDAFNRSGITVMVGDGINDAPPLQQSNIGISINNASQIAINAADVVITGKAGLKSILDLKKVGKHTYLTIKQNLFWALFYNVVAIPLAAMGFLSPIVGVITMAFSDLIVIGNSIRLKTKKIF
ncbi:MAG: cadmium-translocating P-type ATPase [Bacteroidia bacterium]|nr:cadmium-translocating P-type ATPase [Bacteroidia bacterium]